MRFLADENFPGMAIAAIREAGHDIVWVRTVSPGISDQEVLNWAVREDRILLTFDKDFGEIAGKSSGDVVGVILFRLQAIRPTEFGKRLANLISSRTDWVGHFSVIEPGRIRMRRLTNATE